MGRWEERGRKRETKREDRGREEKREVKLKEEKEMESGRMKRGCFREGHL